MNKKSQHMLVYLLIFIFVIQSTFTHDMKNHVYADTDTTSPNITNVSRQEEYFKAEIPNTIYCEVYDDNLIDKVILDYYVNNEKFAVFMRSYQYNTYKATIPGQKIGSIIYYKIEAYDIHGNNISTDYFGPFEVYDGFKPEISNILQTPIQVTNINNVTIQATVTDNIEVKEVTIRYWRNKEEFYTILPMVNISETIYEATIPQQEINTRVTYQIVAIDTSFLNNTGLSSKRSYYVTDGLHPFALIDDIKPSSPKTYEPFDVYIEAFDYDGISSIEIHYWCSQTGIWITDYPTHIDGNYWIYTFSGYPENTNITFYCIVTDNGPNHHTTVTETYSIIIEDSVKPAISDIIHGSDIAYLPYKHLPINATIEDASDISVAIVYYTFFNGTQYIKRGTFMNKIANTSIYTSEIEMHDPKYKCNYWIYAKDSSGNVAISENITIQYYDGTVPLISEVLWNPIDQPIINSQTAVKINCSVIDNNLDTVRINIVARHVNGTVIYNQTNDMVPVIGYDNYYEFVVQNFTDLTTITFTIIATDNTTYEGLPINNTGIYREDYVVLDTHDPQILNVDCEPLDNQQYHNVNISIADINELEKFTVIYGIKQGVQIYWISNTITYTTCRDLQIWSGTITAELNLTDYTGDYLAIKIAVYDSSGHVKEDMFTFLIKDNTPPKITIITKPSSLKETENCIILLEITDYSNITEAKSGFKINYGLETYIDLINNNNGTYTCIISKDSYVFGQILVISFYVTDANGLETQLFNYISYSIGDGIGPKFLMSTLEDINGTKIGYKDTLIIRARLSDDSGIQNVSLHWITYYHDEIWETRSGIFTLNIDIYGNYNYSVTILNWEDIHIAKIYLWLTAVDINGISSQGEEYYIFLNDKYAPSGYITNLQGAYFDLLNSEFNVQARISDDLSLNTASDKTYIEIYDSIETSLIYRTNVSEVVTVYNTTDILLEFTIPEYILETISGSYYNNEIKFRLIVQDKSSNKFVSSFIARIVIDTYTPTVIDESFTHTDLNPNTMIRMDIPIVYDVSNINIISSFYSININQQTLEVFYDSNTDWFYVLLPKMAALDTFYLSIIYRDDYNNSIMLNYTDTILDLANPIIESYHHTEPTNDTTPILFIVNTTDDGYISQVNLIITENGINITYLMDLNINTSLYEYSLLLEKGIYTYYIEVFDGYNKRTACNGGTFTVVDKTLPEFIDITDSNEVSAKDKTDLVIEVTVNDNNGISKVSLYYQINNNTIQFIESTNLSETADGYKIAAFTISESYFLPSDTIAVTKITIEDSAIIPNIQEITKNLPLWTVIDATNPKITNYNPPDSTTFNSDTNITFWCSIEENDIYNLQTLDVVKVYYKRTIDNNWTEASLNYNEILDTEIVKYSITIDTTGWEAGSYNYYFYVNHNNLEDYEGDISAPHIFSITDTTPPEITNVTHTSYENIQDSNGWYDFVVTITAVEYETGINSTIGNNEDIFLLFKVGDETWLVYGTVTDINVDGNTYTITYSINADTIRSFVKEDTIIYYRIHVEDLTNNYVELTSFGSDTFQFTIQDIYAPQSSVEYRYSTQSFQWTPDTPLNTNIGYKEVFQMVITITDESYLNDPAKISIYYKYSDDIGYILFTERILTYSTETSCNETFNIDLHAMLTDSIYDEFEIDGHMLLYFKVKINDNPRPTENIETKIYSLYICDTYDPAILSYANYNTDGSLTTDLNYPDGTIIKGGKTNIFKAEISDGSNLVSEAFKIELVDSETNNILATEFSSSSYLDIAFNSFGKYILSWEISWTHYNLETISDGVSLLKFRIYYDKSGTFLLLLETQDFHLVRERNYGLISGTIGISGQINIISPGDAIGIIVNLDNNVLYSINVVICYRYYHNGDTQVDDSNGIDDDDINEEQVIIETTKTPTDSKITVEEITFNNLIQPGRVIVYILFKYTWDTQYVSSLDEDIISITNAKLSIKYNGGNGGPEITDLHVSELNIDSNVDVQRLWVSYKTKYIAELDYSDYTGSSPTPIYNPDLEDSTSDHYWVYCTFILSDSETSKHYEDYLSISYLTWDKTNKIMYVYGFVEVNANELYNTFNLGTISVNIVTSSSYDNGKVSGEKIADTGYYFLPTTLSCSFTLIDANPPEIDTSFSPTSSTFFEWSDTSDPTVTFTTNIKDDPCGTDGIIVRLFVYNLQTNSLISHTMVYSITTTDGWSQFTVTLKDYEIGLYNVKYYIEAFDGYHYTYLLYDGGIIVTISEDSQLSIATSNMFSLNMDVTHFSINSVLKKDDNNNALLSSVSESAIKIEINVPIGDLDDSNLYINVVDDAQEANRLIISGYYYTGSSNHWEIILQKPAINTADHSLQIYIKMPDNVIDGYADTIKNFDYHLTIQYINTEIGLEASESEVFIVDSANSGDWPSITLNDNVAPKIILLTQSSSCDYSIQSDIILEFNIYEASLIDNITLSFSNGETTVSDVDINDFTILTESSLGINSKYYNISFKVIDYLPSAGSGDTVTITISATADGEIGSSNIDFIMKDINPPQCTKVWESTHSSTNLIFTYLTLTNIHGTVYIYVDIYDSDTTWDIIDAELDITFIPLYLGASDYSSYWNTRTLSYSDKTKIDDHAVRFKFIIFAQHRIMNNLPSTDSKGYIQTGAGAWPGIIKMVVRFGTYNQYQEKSCNSLYFYETGYPTMDDAASTTGTRTGSVTSTAYFYLYYNHFAPPYEIWEGLGWFGIYWSHQVVLQIKYGDTWVDSHACYTYNYESNGNTRWYIRYSHSYDWGSLPDRTFQYKYKIYSLQNDYTTKTSLSYSFTWTDSIDPSVYSISELYGDPIDFGDEQLIQVHCSDNWYVDKVKLQYYYTYHGSATNPLYLWMNYYSGERKLGGDSIWRKTIPCTNMVTTVYYRIVAYDPAGNIKITSWYTYKTESSSPPFPQFGLVSTIIKEQNNVYTNQQKSLPYTTQLKQNDHNFLQITFSVSGTSAYGTLSLILEHENIKHFYPMNFVGNSNNSCWKSIVSFDYLTANSYSVDILYHSYFGFTKSLVKDYNYVLDNFSVSDDIVPIKPTIHYKTTNNQTEITITTQDEVYLTKISYKYQNDRVWQSISFFKQDEIKLSFITNKEIKLYVETWLDSISNYHLKSETITLLPNTINNTVSNHETEIESHLPLILSIISFSVFSIVSLFAFSTTKQSWIKNHLKLALKKVMKK